MKTVSMLAIDLGAESGRAILGDLQSGRLSLREIHRFANTPVRINGRLHWNVDGLFLEMKNALTICRSRFGVIPESCAVDTWGVDFGLLGEDGRLLEFPLSYRESTDRRTMDEVFSKISREKIYELTGIQFMPINSLFQLYALRRNRPDVIERGRDLLFMPDLFLHLLTGIKTTEYTIATTSQLLNPSARRWAAEIFESLELPLGFMQRLVQPGTLIGELSNAVGRETGLRGLRVAASAGHDTAAAVAAVPAEPGSWAFISSGTWSLMGIETREPIRNNEALHSNFTNEGGLCGTNRFLKNISGLWLLQQCRKEWDPRMSLSYEDLVRTAETATPFRSILDPDCPDFLNPKRMTLAIVDYCRRSGQLPPSQRSEFIRMILESLALKYRQTLEDIERVTQKRVDRIHVIGGGSRNGLLCRFTADATGRPVVAGPAEATAAGNIMGQAMALGHVRDLDDIRVILRASSDTVLYEPELTPGWNEAYERFLGLPSQRTL